MQAELADLDPGHSPTAVHPTLKLALLTNIIAPYRVPIYNALAKRFSLHIFVSGSEDNRIVWSGTESRLVGVTVKRSFGATLKYFGPMSGEAYDDRYIHVNPGIVLDLARMQPDAVLSIELGFRTCCALLYCTIARIPLWVWWEGSSYTERDIGPVRRALRRLISRRTDRWISAGHEATEYLLQLGVEPTRIVRAQNCVDEQVFVRPVPAPAPLAERPTVLVVGHLVPRKGVNLFLDVVAQLEAEGMTFSVVIVGDGRERPRLQQQIQDLGLKNVELHHARPPEEIPDYYHRADLLVFPTLHDVWGLVVSEALWSGLPVLASKYAGCASELLPATQVFDPLDPQSFAAVLRSALEYGLPPVDTSRLLRIGEVADAIGNDIEAFARRRTNAKRRPAKRFVQGVVRYAHVHWRDRGLPDRVAIYFHNIDKASYARLEEMFRYFRDSGYVMASPGEFVSQGNSKRRLFVSFDDNFRSWHDAMSVLQRVDARATFYVNTLALRDLANAGVIAAYYSRIDQPIDTMPLSSAELSDLAREGHTIGSHTYSHKALSALPHAEAIEEIRKGRAELEDILHIPIVHFSFPFGMTRHFSGKLREYCKASGLQTVANAIPGCLHVRPVPFDINRTGWDLKQPLSYNLQNVCADGAFFERLTGRSALGNVFSA